MSSSDVHTVKECHWIPTTLTSRCIQPSGDTRTMHWSKQRSSSRVSHGEDLRRSVKIFEDLWGSHRILISIHIERRLVKTVNTLCVGVSVCVMTASDSSKIGKCPKHDKTRVLGQMDAPCTRTTFHSSISNKCNVTVCPPIQFFSDRRRSGKVQNSCQGWAAPPRSLRWSNEGDVKPMCLAFHLQSSFYEKLGLDMFKDGIGVPGLTLRYLFKSLPKQIYFSLFHFCVPNWLVVLHSSFTGTRKRIRPLSKRRMGQQSRAFRDLMLMRFISGR